MKITFLHILCNFVGGYTASYNTEHIQAFINVKTSNIIYIDQFGSSNCHQNVVTLSRKVFKNYESLDGFLIHGTTCGPRAAILTPSTATDAIVPCIL